MILTAVIVEQLDLDGNLRTFRMKPRCGSDLVVAFAGEYDELRTGPFDFLEHQDRQDFESGFAECASKKLSIDRYRIIERGYEFKTSWRGIPTKPQESSYYALSLPINTVPTMVKFVDPRSGHEFQKSVVKDLQRKCFVLYLECRSSHGKFDFDLETHFTAPTEDFVFNEYDDTSSIGRYEKPFDFGGNLEKIEQEKIHIFLELAPELEKFLEVAKTRNADKDDLEKTKSIEDAIRAANSGDSASVRKHLGDVRNWILDRGDKVSSAVLVNAISKVLGL